MRYLSAILFFTMSFVALGAKATLLNCNQISAKELFCAYPVTSNVFSCSISSTHEIGESFLMEYEVGLITENSQALVNNDKRFVNTRALVVNRVYFTPTTGTAQHPVIVFLTVKPVPNADKEALPMQLQVNCDSMSAPPSNRNEFS